MVVRLFWSRFQPKPFKVLKDLMIDRSAFDRIIQSGGYVSIRTGSAPDAHSVAVEKDAADKAFDAATCIGCGACVASCPNASAMLFTGSEGYASWFAPSRTNRALFSRTKYGQSDGFRRFRTLL